RATRLAEEIQSMSAIAAIDRALASAEPLKEVSGGLGARREELSAELVVVQEDLDWLVYAAFDLASEWTSSHAERAAAAARPFLAEAAMPDEWRPRAKFTKTSKNLKILEDKVYKRLWLGRQGVFGHGSKTFAEEVT